MQFDQNQNHSGRSYHIQGWAKTFSTGNRTSSPFSNTPNFDSRIPWSSNHLLAAMTFHAHTWHCVIMHPHLPEDSTKTHEVQLIHWFRCPGHPSSYLNQQHRFRTMLNLPPNCNLLTSEDKWVWCIVIFFWSCNLCKCYYVKKNDFHICPKYLAKSSSIVHRIYVYTVIIGPSQHCLESPTLPSINVCPVINLVY